MNERQWVAVLLLMASFQVGLACCSFVADIRPVVVSTAVLTVGAFFIALKDAD